MFLPFSSCRAEWRKSSCFDEIAWLWHGGYEAENCLADAGGPRAPLQPNFDDPEGWDTSVSEEECSQQDVVQRMVPVAGRPIIMCGTSGCSGSCSLSAVENGYEAGKKPVTCQTCGKIFPRPNGTLSNTSPAMYRRSSVVSWSDSPHDQAVPKSVEAVMEDCTEPHQTWTEMLGEQSRSQVETALPAAVGPCAPSEPVPHSSGFVATSEHAVISGRSAGSFSPVQSIPRVDCLETHGFGGVESVTRATYFSMPSKPVFFSPGLAVTSEHAVEAVIPGFSAESSAAVQGKSCVDRAVSHGFDVAMSGGSCGKDTSPAHLARLRPGVGTHAVRTCWLSWSWGCVHQQKRNLEAVQRHSKALKKAQRDAKRKFVAQPEISHEAAELISTNHAARIDEKFPGTIHVSHQLALLHGHENRVFLHTVWCRQRWWSFLCGY